MACQLFFIFCSMFNKGDYRKSHKIKEYILKQMLMILDKKYKAYYNFWKN